MFCCRRSRASDDDPSTPRTQGRSRRTRKNPYSNRGREKFAKLLADLEARRGEIMAQMGEHGVSIIGFCYSNSHGWVPIVAKIKNLKQAKIDATVPTNHPIQQNSKEAIIPPSGSLAAVKDVAKLDAKMKSFSRSLNKNETALWWPCYWPAVVILILLCLVVSGRPFAIICTSIWWYLIPTVKGEDVHRRRSMKKYYERRLSDKKVISSGTPLQPKMRAMEVSSPKHQAQGRKK